MLTVYQGNDPYTDESRLVKYIAELSHSKNFGMFFGAGASVDAGGLVIGKLWDNFRIDNPDAMDWLIRMQYISEREMKNWNYEGSNFNLEKLLDSLSATTEFYTRLRNSHEIENLTWIKEKISISVIEAAMLDKSLWEEFPKVENIERCLGNHILVLKKVARFRHGKFNPWIFTSNYDLAFEWSAKHADIRINKGILDNNSNQITPFAFDRTDNMRSGTEMQCEPNLVKVHGSIIWEERNEDFFELDENRIPLFLTNLKSASPKIPNLLILPGSSKYVESTQFLYSELIRKFSDFLSKSDPVLFIVGYSFGDRHINHQIISALRFRNELKVVVYLPEFEKLIANESVPKDLNTIIELGEHNVTIVCGGESAYFDVFAKHLPEK